MARRSFTAEESRTIGHKIGIDFGTIDIEQFQMGLGVELEHGTRDPDTDVTGDDLETTGRIALAHLREIPDYYTHLRKMEAEAAAR